MSQALAETIGTLRPDASRAETLQAIQSAQRKIAAALAAAIAALRAAARQSAQQQVIEETVVIGALVGEDIAPVAPTPDGPQEDQVAAQQAANAYASSWLGLALVTVAVWARGERKASPALGSVATRIEHHIVRIVRTEAARARNDEHLGQMVTFRRAYSDRRWMGDVFRRWDARLDRVVCSTCRFHESEEAPLGRPFRLGHEPGDVHPNCRCIATTLYLPSNRNDVAGVNARVTAPYVESAATAAA